jgi:DNA-binding NarL/FixJ family response regulator
MERVRILVADSHDVVRRSIRATLEGEPAWSICDEAKTGLETLAKTIELLPDVVVLDIGLPGLNGVEVIRELRRLAPAVHVLVLTMHRSRQLGQHLYEAGAHGYVPKADVGRALVDAVKAAIAKRPIVSHLVPVRAIADHSAGGAASEPRAPLALPGLTGRQRQVLKLLAEGRSNKEIASLLIISAKTVETHRARIMSKLGLRSMSELVRYAIRQGVINA